MLNANLIVDNVTININLLGYNNSRLNKFQCLILCLILKNKIKNFNISLEIVNIYGYLIFKFSSSSYSSSLRRYALVNTQLLCDLTLHQGDPVMAFSVLQFIGREGNMHIVHDKENIHTGWVSRISMPSGRGK